jgi:hypothetical protein
VDGPEIAAYLNVATSTADVHIHRGTHRLRKELIESPDTQPDLPERRVAFRMQKGPLTTRRWRSRLAC